PCRGCSFSSMPPPPPTSTPLSLHDALPILAPVYQQADDKLQQAYDGQHHPRESGRHETGHCQRLRHRQPQPQQADDGKKSKRERSEEHTSELQSRENLVCRLLLEKKNNKRK